MQKFGSQKELMMKRCLSIGEDGKGVADENEPEGGESRVDVE